MVDESDEGDNVAAAVLIVVPAPRANLLSRVAPVSGMLFTGQDILLTFTVVNSGNTDSIPCQLSLRLSATDALALEGATLEPSRVLFGALTPGETVEVTVRLRLEAADIYTVFADVDSG